MLGSSEDLWNSYNSLLISDDVGRIQKLLSRYELFKLAQKVPGDIVECGVFKGAGLFYWLKLLKIFCPGEARRVVGFDTFDSFASTLLDYEKKEASAFVGEAGFVGVDTKELDTVLKNSGFSDSELVKGDVINTIPEYCKNNPGFRISLLNLDLDTYKGTKAALDGFWPHVSRGGIVVLDEYGKRGWGESDAVDEFIANNGIQVELVSVKHSSRPSAYLHKI